MLNLYKNIYNEVERETGGQCRLLRIKVMADPVAQSPEQIYVEQETLRELYEGLETRRNSHGQSLIGVVVVVLD